MQLIQVKRLLPIRNEEGKIYKWEEQECLVSPTVVLRVWMEKAVDHVILRFTNGEEFIIEDHIDVFRHKYRNATE